MHASCVCNEMHALATRVFPSAAEMTALGRQMLRLRVRRAATMLKMKEPLHELSSEQFLQMVTARKRRIYQSAVDSLATVPASRVDAKVKMFVKAEKMDTIDTRVASGGVVKPRAIQARTPRFNVAIGRFLKSFEHRLYAWKGWKRGVPRTRIIAKGLNQVGRGSLMLRKLEAFDDPRVLTVDANAFDSCVSQDHLRLVHGLYLTLLQDREFQRLLNMQLVNSGTTSHGIRYVTRGKRMSGDMDTALGNCITMMSCVAAAMQLLFMSKWDLLNDGDDCLLIVEKCHVNSGFHTQFRAAMMQLGFRCDSRWCGSHDRLVYEDIEFCRGRLVQINGQWRFVRSAQRALSGFLVSHKHYHDKRAAPRIMKGMAQCELIVGRGMPCLQALAGRVLSLLEDYEYTKGFESEEWAFKARLEVPNLRDKVELVPITEETRVSFARAFGITPDMQRDYEAWCEKIQLHHMLPTGREETLRDADTTPNAFDWHWLSSEERIDSYDWH